MRLNPRSTLNSQHSTSSTMLEKTLPTEYYTSDGDLREGTRPDLLPRVDLRGARRRTFRRPGECGSSRSWARACCSRARARAGSRRTTTSAATAGPASARWTGPPGNRTPLERAATAGSGAGTGAIRCPVSLLDLRSRRQAPRSAVSQPGSVPPRRGPLAARLRDRRVGRLLLPEPLARGAARPEPRAVPRRRSRNGCAAIRSTGCDRPAHRLRGPRELEGRRRELQRVLPLRGSSSRALRGRSGVPREGRRGPRLGAWHPSPRRRLHVHALRDADRAPFPGLSERGEDPAQGRAPLSEPVSLVSRGRARRGVPPRCRRRPTGRGSSATFSSTRRRWREPGFDPSDAVEFWDLINRQDWAICEEVQRGISSRVHRFGYYAPMEDQSLDIRRYVLERLG